MKFARVNGKPVQVESVADTGTFEFTVDHDGRIGSIERGSVVRIKRCERITGDGVYLVRLSGAVMLRRVQVLPGWRYHLSCDEKAYRGVTIGEGNVEVLGRLVEVIQYPTSSNT